MDFLMPDKRQMILNVCVIQPMLLQLLAYQNSLIIRKNKNMQTNSESLLDMNKDTNGVCDSVWVQTGS